MKLVGHGIVTATSPRMATQDATHGEVKPLEWAVSLDGLYGIGRTGGSEAAGRGRERRDDSTVEVDGDKQKEGKELAYPM